ncbi:EIN3-binding F-box protein 1 [Rhynchospora pubera]|uniref:EIN3-binding F-box protein 1 n=1 Tax=Rhynchospora pubera TaxID=906938 RepID=A0AAV8F8A3_9POAL|nr:EIN3-binding F-box protein 1 [Rhynchospora pubera]
MSTLVNFPSKNEVCAERFLFPHYSGVATYQPPCKRSRITAPFCFAIAEDKFAKLNQKWEEKRLCYIDALPNECLFEILRRLPGARERCASACVSKKWLSVLSSIRSSELPKETKTTLPDLNEDPIDVEEETETEECLQRSLEGKKATDIRLAAISISSGSRGTLGKLTIQGSHPTRGVTDKGLTAIGRGCPSLRVLSIWNVSRVTDTGLSEIADGCPLLEKVDLVECPLITDKGLIAIAHKCPNLTSLNVESCVRIGNDGLQAIGQCCPKLISVTIKNCPLVGDKGICDLVSSAGAYLTKVKLHGLNIGDHAIANVGFHGKGVTDLTLSGLQLVAERGFWVMANTLGLQKLKSVAIISCPGLTDLGLASIAKCCPGLKQVHLRRCSQVSDAGVKAFCEAAKLLESLQLEECNRITLNGVLSALIMCGPKFKSLSLVKCLGIKDIITPPGMVQIPSCASLRSLTVRNCPGFTDASLAMVGKICPMLENIELSGLGDVSDHGLLPLINTCAGRLVNVNLCKNANLTDIAVTSLVKANGNTLKLLNLDGCKKVTDKTVMEIVERCAVLEELDLSRSMVSDYGISVLASAKQLKLRVLSLAGCQKLTGKGVILLGNMGKSLEGLNLLSCNLVNSYNLASLEEKLWWCDILV